jgi:hypothetical protein
MNKKRSKTKHLSIATIGAYVHTLHEIPKDRGPHLSKKRMAEVENHVKKCNKCFNELETFDLMQGLLISIFG